MALKSASQKLDAVYLRYMLSIVGDPAKVWQDGTTLSSILIKGDKFYCCNLGDSRCVMSQNRKAIALSQDHVPSNPKEKARIERAGSEVKNNRINGILAVSRGIGDALHKELETFGPKASTAKPSVKEFPLDKSVEFIIVACDGLWDVVSNDVAVRFVSRRLNDQIKVRH